MIDMGQFFPDSLCCLLGLFGVCLLCRKSEKTCSKKKKVAVIELEGIIMPNTSPFVSGINFKSVKKMLDKAFKMKPVAILLNIDSPGGSPAECELITDYIKELCKANESVKIFSFVKGLGASGGYWLACAGEKIYVMNTSVVGSIGVVSGGFGFDKAIEKLGIERRVLHAGENKVLNDPFLPVNPKGQEILQRMIDQIHKTFISHVKNSRGERIQGQDHERLFSGEVWIGQDAIDLGLADALGDVKSFIRENYGEHVITYITPKNENNPFQMFGSTLGVLQKGREPSPMEAFLQQAVQFDYPKIVV